MPEPVHRPQTDLQRVARCDRSAIGPMLVSLGKTSDLLTSALRWSPAGDFVECHEQKKPSATDSGAGTAPVRVLGEVVLCPSSPMMSRLFCRDSYGLW
jgi:hypothetical protein